MKDLNSIQTSTRDEMVCPNPRCHHEGLIPNEAFVEDYSGKAAILKATKCPNPDCKYHSGVPKDIIEEQYHNPSLVQKTVNLFKRDGSGDGLNIGSMIIYGFIILGLIAMSASFLGVDLAGMLSGDSTGDIEGYVVGVNGTAVEGVTVELEGTSQTATTNADGEFVFTNMSHGVYSVVAYPNSDDAGIVEQRVVLSGSGLSAQSNLSRATTISSNKLGMKLVSVEQVQRSETLSSGESMKFSFISPKNLGEGMDIMVSPLDGTETTESVRFSSSKTVNVPDGHVRNTVVSVTGTVTSESFTESYTYRGRKQSVQVYGNLVPSNLRVSLSESAGTPQRSVQENVSDGEAVIVDVSGGSSVGSATVILSGGQTTAPTTREGVYSGTNPTVSIDSESAPSQTTVTLTGNIDSSSKTVNGVLSGSSFSHDFEGNVPAVNATITFTGGEPVDGAISDQTVRASGQGGTTTDQVVLTSNAESGEYRLELNYTILKNAGFVDAGYNINGNRYQVESGSSTVSISAEEGDTIALWLTAEQEEVPQSSYTHNGYFTVKKTEVSSNDIEAGGSVGVRATISNPSSATRTENVYLFKDGKQVQSERITISSGGSTTVTFDRVGFSESGVHSIEVNEDDPVEVRVGDAQLSYGRGELSGRLIKTSGSGSIAFDTTGDGSFDCQVSSDGGSCNIGKISSGVQSLPFEQKGVTNTSYELSYTSRVGAKGVSVDIDGDGADDITHPSVLENGETVSKTVQLGAGTHTIRFNVENGGDVPYTLKWTEAGVVNQPTVTMNGQVVIDESDSFKGERRYDVGVLPGGENTFRFSSESGDPYIAEIVWSESSEETTPRLLVNGKEACSKAELSDRNCKIPISMVTAGSNSFEFVDGANDFEYTVSQTARATPSQIRVTVNGASTSIVRSAAVSESNTGSWTARTQVSGLQSGENTVNISTSQVNGLSTNANGVLNYTYDIEQAQYPKLIVTNVNGNRTVNVSDSALNSEGYLSGTTTVTIPRDVFVAGDNKITAVSENGGGFKVTVKSVNESVSTPISAGNETNS